MAKDDMHVIVHRINLDYYQKHCIMKVTSPSGLCENASTLEGVLFLGDIYNVGCE